MPCRAGPFPGFPCALLICVLLAGAGCQPVPQPFAHDGVPDIRLLDLPDSAGIVVMPVEQAPAATSTALGKAMAEALQKANVPATTRGGNRASAHLLGHLEDDGRDARLVWELVAPDGRSLGSVSRTIEGTPIAPWAAGEPRLMATIAGKAVPAIAALVQEQTPSEVRVPPIYVQPVEGATGDGNARLRTAMRLALGSRQLVTADAPDTKTLVLAGRVAIAPVAGASGTRLLRLVWTVYDPDTLPVGEIAQENQVPAAALETGWAAIATEAARDAAGGIDRMLRAIDWRKGFAGAGPPAPPRSPAATGDRRPSTGLDRPGRERGVSDIEEQLRRELDR